LDQGIKHGIIRYQIQDVTIMSFRTNESQNNVSDSSMLKKHLEKMDKQSEETIMINDGAYCGTDNTKLAASKM